MNTWEDTLSLFIQSSNENEMILEDFGERLVPWLVDKARRDGQLAWLDVGPGDGEKTELIAHRLRLAIEEPMHTTLLEPHMPWHEKLAALNIPADVHIHVVPHTLQNYRRSASLSSFSFISMLHVLYDRPLVDATLDWISDDLDPKRTLIYIVNEHPETQLAHLKALVREQGLIVPETQIGHAIQGLQARGIPFRHYVIGGQRCHLDVQGVLRDDEHWVFPFVLGCSNSDYERLPRAMRERLQQTVREFLPTLSQDYIGIDDQAILIGGTEK